jgi:ribosomal protein S18 acetylase RimI-like enzyme
MPVVVRRAGTAAATIVSALNDDVQAVHAAALPWRFKVPGPDTFPPAVAAEILAKPETLVFIAELAGAPAGYAYAEVARLPDRPMHRAYDMVYLHHISVRPATRRQGVGEALLAAVRNAGKAVGIDLVALDVWAFNEPARAFFRKQGFVVYNERLWNRP